MQQSFVFSGLSKNVVRNEVGCCERYHGIAIAEMLKFNLFSTDFLNNVPLKDWV